MANGRKKGGWLGDVFVAACACALTVSIVGSAVYLSWRLYNRHHYSDLAAQFVASLQNRTPAELEKQVDDLKARPKVARYVLPELRNALRQNRSEQDVCAVIRISGAFVDDNKIRDALFRLRRDPRESVAANAVEALKGVQPAADAAALLGECLEPYDDVAAAPAVVDRVCAGLIDLGPQGLSEMKRRISRLSVNRRIWLVGYVNHANPPNRLAWLEMLAADKDESVRSAASVALAGKVERGALTMKNAPSQ